MIKEMHGKRHVITCRADEVSQHAVIDDDVTDLPKCKNSRSRAATQNSLLLRTARRSGWSGRSGRATRA